MTITGIRPDFIRMSEVFKRFDEHPDIEHILVHTGQHYDKMLSGVFFEELEIRKPDEQLAVGMPGSDHVEQMGTLFKQVVGMARLHQPDLIIFLGDSNSVAAAMPLKKEGFKIGHIEAGMRSFDKRMLEEINRTVCDHCSDIHFVYHDNYKKKLEAENLHTGVVVGNTIVEPCMKICLRMEQNPKRNEQILLDIHRPENFQHPDRMINIFDYARTCQDKFGVPVKMLDFKRTMEWLDKHAIPTDDFEVIPLMSYVDFIAAQFHSLFLISDSGTAQEEPALLDTPVIVPRDFTERPESVEHYCSFMLDANGLSNQKKSLEWLDYGAPFMDAEWLNGLHASEKILEETLKFLDN